MTVAAIVVALALSSVSPTAASTAPVPSADQEEEVDAQALRWLFCVNGHTNVIFRRTGNGCTDGLDTIRFAALHKRPGGYRLQVCATDTEEMGMWVDPADANGNSTGDTIYYNDEPYGPCFNRNIGYRVRKFQAVHLWAEGAYYSSWMPPPT
jgi:hypothetical protein